VNKVLNSTNLLVFLVGNIRMNTTCSNILDHILDVLLGLCPECVAEVHNSFANLGYNHEHGSDRRHVEVSTQPQVDRWWWYTACVVNDRLRDCADKVQDGIKVRGLCKS
jgi:hypothetical protein